MRRFDWTIREKVRSNLRVLVKRILRKYGYPPDKQDKATLTVLKQAEVLRSAIQKLSRNVSAVSDAPQFGGSETIYSCCGARPIQH